MKKKKYPRAVASSMALFGAIVTISAPHAPLSISEAAVPPPPVNQRLGIPDRLYNNMTAAGCRSCHEEPGVTPPGYLVERHHLRVKMPIQAPTDTPYSVNTPVGPSTIYECLSCHRLVYNTAKRVYEYELYRDCLLCHKQTSDQATVHHRSPAAKARDCKACHGPVDNPLDGHFIPTYQASPTTPKPGVGQGACGFCHLQGTDLTTGMAVAVSDSAATHHATGLAIPPYIDYYGNLVCQLCHPKAVNEVKIRACEKCHGMNSLHNIQLDSPNAANPGEVAAAAESPWHGHVGALEDCLGCHAMYDPAITQNMGVSDVLIPNIDRLSRASFFAGSNSAVEIFGSVLTNAFQGEAVDGVARMVNKRDGLKALVAPARISESAMTVFLPSYLTPGRYTVQVVKRQQTSNAKSIILLPRMHIDVAKCVDFGVPEISVVVKGRGFGQNSIGMLPSANSEVALLGDGLRCAVDSWTDIRISGRCGGVCPSEVTVDGLFDAATAPIGASSLSLCATCHEDRTTLVSCSNKKWRAHARKGWVDAPLAASVETDLGLACGRLPTQVKNRAKKR